MEGPAGAEVPRPERLPGFGMSRRQSGQSRVLPLRAVSRAICSWLAAVLRTLGLKARGMLHLSLIKIANHNIYFNFFKYLRKKILTLLFQWLASSIGGLWAVRNNSPLVKHYLVIK